MPRNESDLLSVMARYWAFLMLHTIRHSMAEAVFAIGSALFGEACFTRACKRAMR